MWGKGGKRLVVGERKVSALLTILSLHLYVYCLFFILYSCALIVKQDNLKTVKSPSSSSSARRRLLETEGEGRQSEGEEAEVPVPLSTNAMEDALLSVPPVPELGEIGSLPPYLSGEDDFISAEGPEGRHAIVIAQILLHLLYLIFLVLDHTDTQAITLIPMMRKEQEHMAKGHL
jgi:hypothetical protein